MRDDHTLARIGEAVQLHHGQGRQAEAQRVCAQIWTEIGGEEGDPLHVCVLAHAMADVQDDAREHLRAARAGMGALGDDDYGRLIRSGLDRLSDQLTAGFPSEGRPPHRST